MAVHPDLQKFLKADGKDVPEHVQKYLENISDATRPKVLKFLNEIPPEAVPPEEEKGSVLAFLYRQAFTPPVPGVGGAEHGLFHKFCREGDDRLSNNDFSGDNPYVRVIWRLPKSAADLFRDGFEPAHAGDRELVDRYLKEHLAPEILGIPKRIW